jgi:small subunit ribosomal protein S15Ae
LDEIEKWVNNLLPSRQFGYLGKNYIKIYHFIKKMLFFILISICLVLTTSAGIMDHHEARRKHTGGKIIGV